MKLKVASILFLALMYMMACVLPAGAQDAPKNAAGIAWTYTIKDFGKIEQGKPVAAEFEFKNPSMVPLIISSVRPSCGCTVADFPKEPIQPGKAAKISITFNAASNGVFQKSVLVTSNASEGNTTLIVKGEVVAKN